MYTHTKVVSLNKIFMGLSLLASSALLYGQQPSPLPQLTCVYRDQAPFYPSLSQQQQPLIQFPASPTSSATTALSNLGFLPRTLSLGDLLQPFRGITFAATATEYTAEKSGVKVVLSEQGCCAKIPLYNNHVVLHPHEMVNSDGSKTARNDELVLYDNDKVAVGSRPAASKPVVTPVVDDCPGCNIEQQSSWWSSEKKS